MQRWMIWILCLLVLTGSVLAIDIDNTKRVTIEHEDIVYVFEPDSGINQISLLTDGISIGEDRLFTFLQGGQLIITFMQWGEGVSTVKISSSVPQTIVYSWYIDGKRHFIMQNGTLFTESFPVGLESAQISLVSDELNTDGAVTTVTKQVSWEKRNVLILSVGDEYHGVSYGLLLIIGIILLVVLGLWRWTQ